MHGGAGQYRALGCRQPIRREGGFHATRVKLPLPYAGRTGRYRAMGCGNMNCRYAPHLSTRKTVSISLAGSSAFNFPFSGGQYDFVYSANAHATCKPLVKVANAHATRGPSVTVGGLMQSNLPTNWRFILHRLRSTRGSVSFPSKRLELPNPEARSFWKKDMNFWRASQHPLCVRPLFCTAFLRALETWSR